MKCPTKHSMPVGARSAKRTWHKRKPLVFFFLLLSVCFPAFSQNPAKIPVTGMVADSTGAGLGQVTVSEKGSKNAVITNAEGTFSISVKGTNAVLVFSSVGNISVIPANRSST